MTKAIRIFAIISVVMEVLYLIVGRLLGPFLVMPLFYSGRDLGGDSAAIYVLSGLISGGVIALIYVAYMVLLIFAASGNSEKLGIEISGYVVLGIILPVFNMIYSIFFNLIVGTVLSAAEVGTTSLLNSGSAFFSVMSSVAHLLMIIALTMSLCRKKFVIPLEYELGIGIEQD